MRSDLRSLPTFALIMIVTASCLAPPLVSAQEPPHGEIELPESPLIVNLEDATVQILAGETAEPVLRWWRLRHDAPGSAELSAYQEGASILIERPALPDGEIPAPLRVEIVASKSLALSVFGSDLDLVVEHEVPEEIPAPDIEPPQNPVVDTVVELQLADSRIDLEGVAQLSATLQDCDTTLRGSGGNHELAVIGGRLRAENHRGNMTLRAENAHIAMEESRGRFALTATGGTAELRTVNYRFTIDVRDAGLQILDGKGSGSIIATDSSADLRNTRFENLSLKTTMSHITASQCRGKTNVILAGGSFTIDDGSGELTGLAQDGAAFEAAEHRGNLKLTVQQDGAARIRGIQGDVTLTADSAEAIVEDVNSLVLTAKDSWITAAGVRKLGKLDAIRSEIELDLTDCDDKAVTLFVQNDTRMRVSLETPCRVHAKGLESNLASQIDVTGCELQLGRGGRWATRRVRGIDGKPPVTITAKVAETGELIVEGR